MIRAGNFFKGMERKLINKTNKQKNPKHMLFRLFMEVVAGLKAGLKIICYFPKSIRSNLVVFTDDSEGKEGSSSYLFSNLLLTISTRMSLLSGEMREILYKSTGKFEIDKGECFPNCLMSPCNVSFILHRKDFKDHLQE